MVENAFMKIKNCTENDAWSIVYYLYNLFSECSDMESHEECQPLYNSLVDRLNLNEHADKVLDIIKERYVKNKKLIPKDTKESYRHPFECRWELKENFRQDSNIYERCGRWDTDTQRNVALVRALFTASDITFSKLLAMTFFMSPEALEKCGTKIPSTIHVPAFVKKATENLDGVQFAIDTLRLTKDEAKLLQVVFRTHCIREFYCVCNDLHRNVELSRIDIYSRCLGIGIKDVRVLLKKDQKLVSYGLIDSEGVMDEDAVDAICEKNMQTYFIDIVKGEKLSKAYALESFSVKPSKTDLAVQFLKSENPCNILLYGAPGAGKTEYAKALIKKAGLKMNVYKNEIEVQKDENGDVSSVKGLRRLNCYLSLKKENSILVVDEAETVLKTVGMGWFGMKFSLPQKGTVNKMLETSENKVIWILNYTDELDESTLRRFTYSIRFHEMPKATLRSIAESKFADIKMPKNLKSEILDMCGKYQVTGASVENIVKAVKSMDYSKNNETQMINDVRDVLEANSSLIFGKKKIRDTVKDSYNLDVLNTSIPASDLMEMIKNAIADKEEHPDSPEGIRMLFYGLSGTGKTELARYISEQTGKKLLLKRASDILGKYVGDEEKHIKEAFEEAEETDSILLMDEADSFFADRSRANSSWERTMVNEFLTQMEEFSGILICTTNLRKIMDPAMQRRFHILTEFKPLTEVGIRNLLTSYFGKYQFEDEQISDLLKSDSVTPGDFGSLKSKMRFMSKDKLSSEFIIQELRTIQAEKKMNGGGKIGFAS